uniref:Uncharacterized protein n=1 Tax=Rhizophora mucronata TaxID=61149 RepID=A0A2P2PGX7_RHIMU
MGDVRLRFVLWEWRLELSDMNKLKIFHTGF